MAHETKLSKGATGGTFLTPEFTLRDASALAEHARLSPGEARETLHRLVESIPEEDLRQFVAGQITVIG